jgi:hypothetical protein
MCIMKSKGTGIGPYETLYIDLPNTVHVPVIVKLHCVILCSTYKDAV